MPDRKISELVDGTPLQPTDEFVVARGADNFKIDGADVVAAVTKHDVTLAGNTAGALALISSGTMTLAGGNNITLSQAGNAVTISGGAGGAETQTAISGISASDTLYTSGTVRFTGVGGGVTVSSNTGQRVDISVAAQSVQPETQTFIGGISASDTLYTSGSVRFTGSQAVTVRSGTGQLVIIDAPAQTTQTQNMVAVTLSGNTSGAQALISSGTLTLAGGNNITVSQAGNAVTISGPNVGGAQTGISGISASDTLYTSGSVRFTGSQAVTVRSGTGQLVIIDAPAQTTQTQGILSAGVSTGGNTAGNTGVNTGSRLVIVGSNGITASQGTAAGATTITLSGVTQSTQTQGILSAGVSTGGNTAGNTTVNTGSRMVFAGAGAVSLSQATAAGASTISISVNTQTNQTGTVYAASNTTGTSSGTYDARTLSIAGDGIISVAASNSGWRISASQSVQTQGNLSLGVSTGGNTSGNTTVNTGSRLVFVGTNNITLSQGTAAGATTITISGPSGGAETQTAISGIANSQTTYTSGTVSLSELGAITIRSTTGNQFQFSVNAQTTQTQGVLNAGVSTGGNTSGNTTVNSGSRLVFAGGNNITLSQGTAADATTVTVSAPNASSLSATGIVSISTNGSTISIGAPAYSGGMSTQGNTAGDTGYASQRLNLVGSNNITLSGSTNGGSMTISINAPSPGAAQYSIGVSTGGNTAGDTGVTGTRIVFVGTNNISLSQATDANGATISINQTGGGGGFSAGASTGGNTAGSTGITGTQLVFAGVSPVSLSQSTGANGGTLSILAPATSSLSATGAVSISTNGSTISIGVPLYGTVSMWPPQPQFTTQQTLTAANFATAATRTTLTATVYPMAVEQAVSFNFARVPVNLGVSSATSNSNWSWTMGHSVGIYSLTGDTLSLLMSFSNQNRLSYASTNNSTNASATWNASYGSGTDLSSSRSLSTGNAGVTGFWSSIFTLKWHPYMSGATSIPAGQFFMGFAYSSSSAGANVASLTQIGANNQVVNTAIQDIGRNVASSSAQHPLAGAVTLTQTNTGMPASFGTGDITQSSNVGSIPYRSIYLNLLSQFYAG